MPPLAVVHTLGWTLLHSLWQGALVVVLLAPGLWLNRRSSPNLRYALACGALLLCLLLPVLTYAVIAAPTPSGAGVSQHLTAYGMIESGLVERDPGVIVIPALPTVIANLSSSLRLEIATPYLPFLVGGWLVGVLLLSLQLLGRFLQAERFRRRHSRAVPQHVAQLLNELSRRLGVRRIVAAFESSIANTPLVIGILRPIILIPSSALSNLTLQQLESILAHELAHIRRYDYLMNLLQSVIETLLFYHPAVWWIGGRIRAERENACDDLAVATAGNPLVYARALTQLASLQQSEFALAATGGGLVRRVRRIASIRASDAGVSSWLTGLSTLVTLIGFVVSMSLPQWAAAYGSRASLERPQLWATVFGMANEMTADGDAPAKISARGYIALEERAGGVSRKITVTQAPGGEFVYEYLVDGVPEQVDDAVLAWYRDAFARGIGTVYRTHADPEQIGYNAFIEGGTFYSYVHAYQTHRPLDFSSSRGEILHDGRPVARDDPDFEVYAETSIVNDIGMVTHLAAHGLIGSFPEVQDALIVRFVHDLLTQFEPTPRVSRALLDLAGEMQIDRLKTEMLLALAPGLPPDNAELVGAFREIATTLTDPPLRLEALNALASVSP